MSWKAELELAQETARLAGTRLAKDQAGERSVLSSVGKDIKLQADRDSEAIILEHLATSDYPVLAEESGQHGVIETGEPYWVVDPLDGSLNFKREIPFCCLAIALCQGETPLLGVIHDFNRDELFSGAVGEGASMNGRPIHVSGTRETGQAVLCTGFPTKRDYSGPVLEEFVAQVQQFKKIRMLGSAAMMLTYVACGRVDAYAEDDIMLWDVAAGVALVRAAGGWADLRPSERVRWGRRVRCAAYESIWTPVEASLGEPGP